VYSKSNKSKPYQFIRILVVGVLPLAIASLVWMGADRPDSNNEAQESVELSESQFVGADSQSWELVCLRSIVSDSQPEKRLNARKQLIGHYIQQGDEQAAVAVFRVWLADTVKSSDQIQVEVIATSMAEQVMGHGNAGMAAKLFAELVRSIPNGTRTQLNRLRWASCLARSGDYSAALEVNRVFLTDTRLDQFTAIGSQNYAKSLFELGRIEEALASLEETSQRFVGTRFQATALMLAADLQYANGCISESRQLCQRVLAAKPPFEIQARAAQHLDATTDFTAANDEKEKASSEQKVSRAQASSLSGSNSTLNHP